MNPFRLAASRQATFPKGTALAVAGNFAATPKGVPLGELLSAAKLRGFFPTKKRPALPVEMRGAAWFWLSSAGHSSILPKLKSAKSSTRSVRLGATGAALSASRGA